MCGTCGYRFAAALLLIACSLAGCGDDDGSALAAVTITYPYDGAVFPPDIASPMFRWTDDTPDVNIWRIAFAFADGGEPLTVTVSDRTWSPSADHWEIVKRRSLEGPATVTITGIHAGLERADLSRGSITLSTSSDPVAAPIFYREVNLPFLEAVKDPSHIRWRFGPVSSTTQPPSVLGKLPTCGNCHSFSRDGKVLGMDVDSASDKGSYIISEISKRMVFDQSKVITWSDYKREDGEKTFGLLAQISPDGKRAISMVKDRHVTVGRPELMISQLFFPVKGILAIYDREAKTFTALPGADDRKYVHGSPAWSPDGKTIAFARSVAHELKGDKQKDFVLVDPAAADEFLKAGRTFKFELYHIPFNDGKGGQATPLAGASGNDYSNYFPKYTPDGKWIVFCRAKSFMLLQPDSELFIIPASGGEARRMTCNRSRLNSWHSFSPSGRWMVFSSKVNGPYTQLFLTHIDEQGNDTPPVLLERFTNPAQQRAANIPEFVNAAPDAIETITEDFLDYYCYHRSGTISLAGGDPELALRQYKRSIALNPEYGQAYFGMGLAYVRLGKIDKAIECYTRAVERLEEPAEAFGSLGNLQMGQGKLRQAIISLTSAVRLDPDVAIYHYNLGVAYREAGRADDAVAAWKKAIDLQPDFPEAQLNIGAIYLSRGRTSEALVWMNKAVRSGPQYPRAHHGLASARAAAGDFPGAVTAEQQALKLAETAGQKELADSIRRDLTYYRQGKRPPRN